MKRLISLILIYILLAVPLSLSFANADEPEWSVESKQDGLILSAREHKDYNTQKLSYIEIKLVNTNDFPVYTKSYYEDDYPMNFWNYYCQFFKDGKTGGYFSQGLTEKEHEYKLIAHSTRRVSYYKSHIPPALLEYCNGPHTLLIWFNYYFDDGEEKTMHLIFDVDSTSDTPLLSYDEALNISKKYNAELVLDTTDRVVVDFKGAVGGYDEDEIPVTIESNIQPTITENETQNTTKKIDEHNSNNSFLFAIPLIAALIIIGINLFFVINKKKK